MTPLVSKVRGDVWPKKSLAFTATESEYLRRFGAFRKDIPPNEPLGATERRDIDAHFLQSFTSPMIKGEILISSLYRQLHFAIDQRPRY